MIDAHNLLPADGSLRGPGMKIDFQVEEGRYRVDFLANNWLVIEIDGDAYHSSPEAMKRDAERDEYFEGLGYTVLRIPAKTVFSDPAEAVRRVKAALAVGKRYVPPPEEESGFERLGKTLSGIGSFIDDVNKSVTKAHAVQEALNLPKRAIFTEKLAIDSAVEEAQRNISLQELLAEDDQRAELFGEAYAKLKKFRDEREVPSEPFVLHVPPFTAPSDHSDPETDSSIKRQFADLEE